MRATIYARYSSDNQRDASIEDQVRECRARLEHEGWELVNVYSDHGISGATILRPAYQQLLQDMRLGQFEVIVTEALDRLSRDQENVAGLYKQASFAGVKVFTLAEGEISELHVGLSGAMNALYLKHLAQKTHRGLEGRVRQGRSGGGLCYGYDIEAGGEDDRGKRRINLAEAEIIRRIFREYAAGKSPRKVAYELNAEGVPGPRGKHWAQSTINGSAKRRTGILNNELYIGRLVWNRQRFIKDPATGKRIARLRPESEWVIHDVPELRIVDQELWEKVKRRQGHIRENPKHQVGRHAFWDRRRPRYLFSGLMKCGACGGGYSKVSANLFGCSTARNTGTCDNRINIRRDVLEPTILNGLKEHLMDPELFKEFADEFIRELNRLRGDGERLLAQHQRELAHCESRIKKIVDAIAEGLPARALKAELEELEANRERLEQEVTMAPEPKPLLHPNLAELYRTKVADLLRFLTGDEPDPEAIGLIRSLVDEITLTPENGDLRVDLKGDLAAILNMATNKKPADEVHGLEQVKLVAGARNPRQLALEAWV